MSDLNIQKELRDLEAENKDDHEVIFSKIDKIVSMSSKNIVWGMTTSLTICGSIISWMLMTQSDLVKADSENSSMIVKNSIVNSKTSEQVSNLTKIIIRNQERTEKNQNRIEQQIKDMKREVKEDITEQKRDLRYHERNDHK